MNYQKSLNTNLGIFCVLFLIPIMVVLIFPADSAQAASAVSIWTSEELMGNDTLWNGAPAYLAIFMENDYVLGGMSLGFEFFSYNGTVWTWNNGPCDPPEIACAVPGSRADPDPWDMTGFDVIEYDVDGISPDIIMIGGVALTAGLPTGPLEHLYSIYFTPYAEDYSSAMLCVDSTFVPPSGAFVFVDQAGNAAPPTTLWPSGGKCWPIGGHYHCWAEWDEGLPTELTVDNCSSNSVTLSAHHPVSHVDFELYQLIGGAGQAEVIDNGDETCEVFYTAAPEDVGQEITIIIIADCDDCPSTDNYYDLSVIVNNNVPTLDIGSYYNWGATNNLITKDDVTCIDPDTCDEFTYSLISGPGQIDPATGVYTWMPGPTDIGEYIVTAEVSDGMFADQGEFMVGTHDEACCPGDANFSGTCNVGDVVFLIAYIFQEGPAPRVMNWADANFDCSVNVADAVYLIAYIFNGGPPPEVGCYY